jgi:uncharacterized protein (TIGR02145 family)
MKRFLFAFLYALFSVPLLGQVGVNTSTPNATMDIVARKSDGSSSEGVILPRMSGDNLHTADTNGVYGSLQDGTMVFVTEAPALANRIGQTVNIDVRGFYYFDSPKNEWVKVICCLKPESVLTLDCAGAVTTGSVTQNSAASGVSTQISYTGGNGMSYASQSVSSTGVTGLTATLFAGTLANGNGSVTYQITGTPSSSGTASFPITLGGQSCTFTVPVNAGAVVFVLKCAESVVSGSLSSNVPASGVSVQVPYTGGNGGSYTSQSVSSTGVTGLTATLSSGTLANGSGNVTYTITGTPSSSGTASFPITLGGQSCSFTVTVGSALPKGSGSLSGRTCFDVVMTNDGGDCGTLSSRGSQKADFSQTLTNTQTYTFTPLGTVSNVRFSFVNTNGQVINTINGGNSGNNITGAVTASVAYNTNLNSLASGTTNLTALTANIIVIYNDSSNNTGVDKQILLTVNIQDCACCGAFVAPGVWKNFMCQNLGADTGVNYFTPSSSIHGDKYQWGRATPALTQAQDQANSGAIAGWNTVSAPDGSWSDTSKTANDPCPAGYRVPTQVQWQGVINNNTITRVGTWATSATNYTSAIKFGSTLFLPAAGYRSSASNGTLIDRGSYGIYWSSSPLGTNAYGIYISATSASMNNNARTIGFSVRCISE